MPCWRLRVLEEVKFLFLNSGEFNIGMLSYMLWLNCVWFCDHSYQQRDRPKWKIHCSLSYDFGLESCRVEKCPVMSLELEVTDTSITNDTAQDRTWDSTK